MRPAGLVVFVTAEDDGERVKPTTLEVTVATATKPSTKPAAKAKRSTMDEIVAALSGRKSMTVVDLIAQTGRPATTVRSLLYSEKNRQHPRVVRADRGVFKLTAAGRKVTS